MNNVFQNQLPVESMHRTQWDTNWALIYLLVLAYIRVKIPISTEISIK
jgi:hypothetical protein